MNRGKLPYPLQTGSRWALWFPLGFLLVGILTIGTLWRVNQKSEHRTLQIETEVAAQQLRMRLEDWINSRIAMVSLVAKMGNLDPVHDPGNFRAKARAITDAFPGFQALNFIAPDHVITIVYPRAENLSALGKNLDHHPSPAVPAALGRAERERILTRSPILDLLQGKPGFTTYAPILDGQGKIRGFINGVFSVEKLVTGCLHEDNLNERFAIGLKAEDGRFAYRSPGADRSRWPVTFTSESTVRILDGDWWLQVAPNPDRLAHSRLGPDEFLAAGSLLLVVMLALLLRIYLLGVTELRDSREGYRLLLDNIADMVVKAEPGGALTFCSPSFSGFLDKPLDEILGTRLASHFHPEDRQILLRSQRHILDGASSQQFEARLETPAGYHWTQWTCTPLRNAQQQTEGTVSVGRDIQEKRMLEEQLRRSQKLQAVGQLAGGIAHDFNNIIQAIEGYVEFALEDLPAGSPARRDLEQAYSAAERAAVLTGKILAFSSKQSVRSEALDLNDIIAGIRPMLKSMVGEGIDLVIRTGPEPALVLADPGQIEQILMNLCLNAREAMSGSGRMIVSLREATFAAGKDCPAWARPGRWIELAVQDFGSGIPLEIQDQIFEPFFTTRPAGKGTGLGLATVYGIVKQHGGFIHLDSEVGRGTTLAIHLPPTDQTPAMAATASTRSPRGAGQTVLVVEDEDLVREMAARILTQAGYQVLTAADGEQALALAAAHAARIEAVLMDIVLPGRDGRQVHAEMAELIPRAGVLFMSGYDPQTSAGPSGQGPAKPLLAKPFSREQLLQAVSRILTVT